MVGTIAENARPDHSRSSSSIRGYAFALAMLASVTVAIAIWLHAGGDRGLGSYVTALNSIGLLTGLLASDLMVVQVVLLARVPWLEATWGHDVLVRAHRWTGFASFWFMIAHVYAYTVERVSGARSALWDRIWSLYVDTSWMVWATIGTALLVLVTVTSIRNARRHLRYEAWYLLHLYAYLGMAFAFPHQLFTGRIFAGTWSRVYWWAIYLIAAGAIAIYRVALPLWRSWRHRLRVVDVRMEAPGITSISMAGRDLDRLNARAGQFFVWRFLGRRGWAAGHPYSLSAAPDGRQLRITVQETGSDSRRTAHVGVGTPVLFEGPYGVMTPPRRADARPLLCIAAGVGVTVMRSLLQDVDRQATLIYRVSTPERVLFREEFDAIAARSGLRVIHVSGPRGASDSWLPAGPDGRPMDGVTWLRAHVPEIAACDIYLCGPSAWMALVRGSLRAAGVPHRRIHSEDYSW